MRPDGHDGWPAGFAGTDADRDALLVLSHLESTTPREMHALAWQRGSASRCLRAVRSAGSEGDGAIAGAVSPAQVKERLARCGARVVVPGDAEYPGCLLELTDPPACLFVRGHRLDGSSPAVAVVGARACSPYGAEAARLMGEGLASSGVVVVSGAALGIDGEAHRGALAAGGPTVAVLGSGIDMPHPRRHQRLIEEVAASGTVVSEYPPGKTAQPRRFPARNRLIAALSRAVVVVEGAAGSGSLITVEFASQLGRDVLAVPGPVTSPLSQAPHALIHDGAGLVRGPEDVLAALRLDLGGLPGTVPASLRLTRAEERVYGVLAGGAVAADAVVAGSRLGTPGALTALASLEMRGLVREVGGRYERTRS